MLILLFAESVFSTADLVLFLSASLPIFVCLLKEALWEGLRKKTDSTPPGQFETDINEVENIDGPILGQGCEWYDGIGRHA